MAIPTQRELSPIILEFLSDGQEHAMKDLRGYCEKYFQLSDEEKEITVPSDDSVNLFANRIYWARLSLKTAGLIEAPQRGIIRLTQAGLDNLHKGGGVQLPKKVPIYQQQTGFSLSTHQRRRKALAKRYSSLTRLSLTIFLKK